MSSPSSSSVKTWVPWGTGTGASTVSLAVNWRSPAAGTGSGIWKQVRFRNSVWSFPGTEFIRSTV